MAAPDSLPPNLRVIQESVANGQGMDALMESVQKRGLEEENQRLRDAHDTYTDAAGGKLTLAPVDLQKPGLRVLDSATADGTWLKDLRNRAGAVADSQTYVGTDLVEGLFPTPRPAGIEFYKQSITDEWPKEWHESFDLVHQRQVLGFCGDYPLQQAIANFASLAKPGGWVELVELDLNKNMFGEGSAAQDFFRVLEQIWILKNMGGNFGKDLKGLMEAVGLEDVEETLCRSKIGAKARPERMEASINGAAGAGPMIIAMAKTLPGLQGFTQEQLDGLNDRVREELLTVGGEFDSFFVRGRVPAGGLKLKK